MSELIARVMSRVIEVGNCLEWTGAYSLRVPAVAWKGKQMNVRRALAIDLQLLSECCANKVAVVCCGNWRCVAPDHVRVITRKKLQQQTANAGHHASQIIANRKRSRSARRRAKLTEEQVAEQDQARAQAQNEAKAMEATAVGVQAAEGLSKVDVGGGQNAISMLLNNGV